MNDAGHMIGHAIFGNGLYHLDAAKPPSDDMTSGVTAATVDFDDPVWKWHRNWNGDHREADQSQAQSHLSRMCDDTGRGQNFTRPCLTPCSTTGSDGSHGCVGTIPNRRI